MNFCVSHVVCIICNCSQSNSRHSHGQMNFQTNGISHSFNIPNTWYIPFSPYTKGQYQRSIHGVLSRTRVEQHLHLSMITCEFPFSRILNSPTCMISHVCISMHMHNSCFINSCMIILIDYTCVKAHTWHVFSSPLNFGSHLSMGLEINSSQNSHFCMTLQLQYSAFMTHGEYFCLCVNFWSFCMTWVQSLHPCFPLSLLLSLPIDFLLLLLWMSLHRTSIDLHSTPLISTQLH